MQHQLRVPGLLQEVQLAYLVDPILDPLDPDFLVPADPQDPFSSGKSTKMGFSNGYRTMKRRVLLSANL